MWDEIDLTASPATNVYIKCQEESPCSVEYYKDNKWTEFHGKPTVRVGMPVLGGATHADGSPASKAECPRICAEKDDCTAFYHNPKTDECELFINNENWAMSKKGVAFKFTEVDGGYTMAKCKGRCLHHWGKDSNDCFPEKVQIECRPDGLKFNAKLRLVFKLIIVSVVTRKRSNTSYSYLK